MTTSRTAFYPQDLDSLAKTTDLSLTLTRPMTVTWTLRNSAGAIVQTVLVGVGPELPAFDGTNIWVPNNSGPSVSVVRASTGAVLQTLTGNGLSGPFAVAFDGQRVIVTNTLTVGVSLWKAADLTPLGNFPIVGGDNPTGACSDGVNFWVTLTSPPQLLRF